MNRPERKRDITFPLVLSILLLFPFLVDEMFVQLKQVLRENGGVGGLLAYPDFRPTVRPLRPNHCQSPLLGSRGFDPSWPPCGNSDETVAAAAGLSNAFGAPTPPVGGGGLPALAASESARWEQIRANLRDQQGSLLAEHWEPIEPMPSNPSRWFPEYPHPRLSSGVLLTTSPNEPKEMAPPPNREIASLPTPAQPFTPPESSRLPFRAKIPAAAAAEERLLEVCGRMVPESRAPAASYDCIHKGDAPKAANAPAPVDEGGNQTLIFP